jgi:hypothetical protein
MRKQLNSYVLLFGTLFSWNFVYASALDTTTYTEDETTYGTIKVLKEFDSKDTEYLERILAITCAPETTTSYNRENLVAFLKNLGSQDMVIEFLAHGHDPYNPLSGAYAVIRMIDGEPNIMALFTGKNVRVLHIPRFFAHYIAQKFSTRDITFRDIPALSSAWIQRFIIGGLNVGATAISDEEIKRLSPLARYTNSLIRPLHFHYNSQPTADYTMYPASIGSAGSNPTFPLIRPIQEQPVAILTAAIPGAGKNTVLEELERLGYLDNFVMIDIDSFVSQYLPKEDFVRTPEEQEKAIKQAYTLAWEDVVKTREEAMKEGRNILLPTTFQSLRNLEVLQRAILQSHHNYRIVFVNVSIDLEIARERALIRALTTNRAHIPDEYMKHCQENVEINRFILQMGRNMGFPTLNFENNGEQPLLRSIAYFRGHGETTSSESQAWTRFFGEETLWTLNVVIQIPLDQIDLHRRAAINAAIYGFEFNTNLNNDLTHFQRIPNQTMIINEETFDIEQIRNQLGSTNIVSLMSALMALSVLGSMK